MTDYRFPHGGKAWFVRRWTATSFKVEPCSREGWIATGVFVVLAALGSVGIILIAPDSVVSAVASVAFTIVLACAFVVLSIRMSVPDPRNRR